MNAPNTPADLRADYYATAASWAEDRRDGLRLSRRIAWIVAGVAAGVAMLEAVALALLMPLKTVVPYTLLVDRHTGYVQALQPGSAETLIADQALAQSLLAQYVIAREGFDVSSVAADYRKVALWSAERARSDYLARMPASNPASPFRQLPRSSTVAVHVKSVSMLAPYLALVRFDLERRDQGQVEGRRQPFAAVVRYRFSGAPMALEDRLVNPLGFQVVQYRRDQEAPPPPPAAPVPAATAPVPVS